MNIKFWLFIKKICPLRRYMTVGFCGNHKETRFFVFSAHLSCRAHRPCSFEFCNVSLSCAPTLHAFSIIFCFSPLWDIPRLVCTFCNNVLLQIQSHDWDWPEVKNSTYPLTLIVRATVKKSCIFTIPWEIQPLFTMLLRIVIDVHKMVSMVKEINVRSN